MQETSTIKSMISNRNRDCLGCRIFSGCGLIGSGLYVAYHSKKFQKWTGKTTMYTMGSGNLSICFYIFLYLIFKVFSRITCFDISM